MRELAKLQDNMPTFPTQDARATIERELGQPIDSIFSEFSARPVAAASLAQVYNFMNTRTTPNGEAAQHEQDCTRTSLLASLATVSIINVKLNCMSDTSANHCTSI